jgi:nucleoside-diphosphate-sugar epimerase
MRMQSNHSDRNQSNPVKPVVLITGVSGLIGTRLAQAFSRDYQVVGLDIKPPGETQTPIDWIDTDLTQREGVAAALGTIRGRYGDRLASVLHLAAYYDFSGEPSPLYKELTVEGTRRLLQGLRQFDVEQFVFSSSLLVMRPQNEGGQISELSPTEAKWNYPRSKLEAEQVIREERGNIPTVILRIAGVYDENCRSLPVSQQIRRIYERQLESYFFPGDPKRGQALVHLDDLTDCFLKVVELRGDLNPEELFLIAEPDVMSYRELQDRLGELIHGWEWTTVRIPKFVAKAGARVQEALASDPEHKPFIKPWMIDLADDHYSVNIAHARVKLHWEPKHRLRDTLEEMIRRLKADPERWYKENKLPLPEKVPAG